MWLPRNGHVNLSSEERVRCLVGLQGYQLKFVRRNSGSIQNIKKEEMVYEARLNRYSFATKITNAFYTLISDYTVRAL